MSGTGSGPPDHPGTLWIQLSGSATTDQPYIESALAQGYEYLLTDGEYAVFVNKYGGQGKS